MDEAAKREWELMELLSAAWDDRLDEPSRDKLEELLSRDDFAGVQLLTEFTRMHIDLEWLISSKAAQRKALDAVARVKARPVRTHRWRLPGNRLISIAAATLLFFVVVWQLASWNRDLGGTLGKGSAPGAPIVRPPLPVGRIVGHAGIRWAEGRQLRDGQTLLEGQVIDLAAGTARISMDFGAEMLLQAPCRATLISDDMVTLETGTIVVKVADWAVGFKVRTNDVIVTDLGTQFMVHADARAGSEVHVLHGRVIASSLRSTQQRSVGAAQAIRVRTGGGLNTVAFRREPFAKALGPFQPLRSIKLANTGIGVQVGDRDRHWSITAGNAEYGPYPQPATVCEADATYGSNDPAKSQWISVKEGTTSGVPVRTKYTFETSFDLTRFDPSSVRLTGLVLADNGVEEIRLNGKPLPIAPWHDWYPEVTFFAFHRIEISNGFLPGKNVLSFVVMNETVLPPPDQDATPPETPNPMGLRIEWLGSGRPR
jgi:hypothetical protein